MIVTVYYFVRLDAPQDTTITGPNPIAEVGDTFLCESDSNPSATYNWFRLEGTGPDWVEGDTLTVDDTMGSFNRYQCFARNNLGTDTAVVNFTIGTGTRSFMIVKEKSVVVIDFVYV